MIMIMTMILHIRTSVGAVPGQVMPGSMFRGGNSPWSKGALTYQPQNFELHNTKYKIQNTKCKIQTVPSPINPRETSCAQRNRHTYKYKDNGKCVMQQCQQSRIKAQWPLYKLYTTLHTNLQSTLYTTLYNLYTSRGKPLPDAANSEAVNPNALFLHLFKDRGWKTY